MNTLRHGLPPLPERMLRLPIDARGYPVPWFVAWIDAVPDHRIADSSKIPQAIRGNLCWICGDPLGVHKAFVGNPLIGVTRATIEPPSHRECAMFAVCACPFMTKPQAKRRVAGLPGGVHDFEGTMCYATVEDIPKDEMHNPGVTCVWITRTFEPFREGQGLLFHVGEPESVGWYAEGRAATYDEVSISLHDGLVHIPVNSFDEQAEVKRRLAAMERWLP